MCLCVAGAVVWRRSAVYRDHGVPHRGTPVTSRRVYDPREYVIFFSFHDTATTEIYTLSLHDALPISLRSLGALLELRLDAQLGLGAAQCAPGDAFFLGLALDLVLGKRAAAEQLLEEAPRLRDRLSDRKSTRLNSSHLGISYAVFCLKK